MDIQSDVEAQFSTKTRNLKLAGSNALIFIFIRLNNNFQKFLVIEVINSRATAPSEQRNPKCQARH